MIRLTPAALLSVLVVLLGTARASAHDIGAMLVEGVFSDDAQLRLCITIDPEHLPPSLRTLVKGSGCAEAIGEAVLRSSRAAFDGRVSALEPAPIDPGSPQMAASAAPKLRLVFTAAIPAGAAHFVWRCDFPVGQYLLRLSNQGDDETNNQWLEPGVESRSFPLRWPSTEQSRFDVIWMYLRLGFVHIVPEGLDHILFVLGLFLLTLQVKPILWQVTAFTVAHSITLGLSMYDVVRLAPSIVEPAIAVSIAFIGLENLLVSRFRWRRVALVFAFGLLHGMGLAGVLRELVLSRSQFVPALVSFNVGVELGHLAVIGAAFLTVGLWCGAKSWYRTRVTVPASVCICCVGLYWTAVRILT